MQTSTFSNSPTAGIKDAWNIAKPYWISKEKYKSLILIISVIILNLLTIYMTVKINKWYNVFYSDIQRYDKIAFFKAINQFCIIVICAISFQLLAFYLRKILEARWRRWLTKYYLNNWLYQQSYYNARFLQQVSDNPDQRISEDINSFIVISLDLTLGLLNSIVTLASFVVILWNISGPLQFTLYNHQISITGYMVYVAVLYAIIGTYITFKIGKPLIKLNFKQQSYEANFRYGLMRIREYSEDIAFYKGETQEKSGLIKHYTNLVNNFFAIIYRQLKINVFNIGYSQLAVIFPFVVSAPRYFAKTIQLGDLMQISSAFGKVQDSLSYFIEAYSSIAGWRAVVYRLHGFEDMVTNTSKLDKIKITSSDYYLKLENFTLNLPNGQNLAKNIQISLKSGDRLLIIGRSGVGKTTLLRAIAQLWPFTHGAISQKPNLSSLFVAQKPYMPLGSLKDTICYPQINNLLSDRELINLLEQFNLNHLTEQLNIVANWSNELSIGEQQRIAFCRILVNQPDIVYLDESTSALDEESEELMYKTLIEKLPNSAIISIGHRSTIKKWHNQELNFNTLAS